MTKAQEVFEKVEALVASGIKKADAFHQVADELGQPFNSIRGAYYTHTRSIGGTPGARNRDPEPEVDPIEGAVAVLTTALESIDRQIETAKQTAEEAAAIYKELRDSAAERKALIKAKIEGLNAAT
jgi:hypothetical protein